MRGSRPPSLLLLPLIARLALVCGAMTSSVAGCGPSPADVARLRDEGDDGPERLATIVETSRGSVAVQTDAALALVTLTRHGRHVGLDLLAPALAARTAESRTALVEAVSAELVKGMTLPRGPTDDPALAHKDGAYVLHSRDLATGATKEALGRALSTWVRESPMERLDDTRQRYGAMALLHALGPSACRALSRFFDDDRTYPRALDFVLVEGDDEAKHAASVSLVRLVSSLRTPAWRETKRPEIEAANHAAKVEPDPLLVDRQLRRLQSRELGNLFRALARLDYPEASAALLLAGEDHDLRSDDRIVALESLGKQVAKLDDAQLDRVLAIATTSARLPASSEQAARAEAAGGQPHYDSRLAREALLCAVQVPRARGRLLALVSSPRAWRLRMEAAAALLRGAKPNAFEEVLARLPTAPEVPMALVEITTYGLAIASSYEGKAAARAHLGDTSLGARLTALASLRDDRATLERHAQDEAPLPRCSAADECDWTCREAPVTTVGAYVRKCLL